MRNDKRKRKCQVRSMLQEVAEYKYALHPDATIDKFSMPDAKALNPAHPKQY